MIESFTDGAEQVLLTFKLKTFLPFSVFTFFGMAIFDNMCVPAMSACSATVG